MITSSSPSSPFTTPPRYEGVDIYTSIIGVDSTRDRDRYWDGAILGGVTFFGVGLAKPFELNKRKGGE